MDKKSVELRAEKERSLNRAQELNDLAFNDGDRAFTADESAEYDKAVEHARSLDDQIQKAERKELLDDMRSDLHKPQARVVYAEPINHAEKSRWKDQGCLAWFQSQETGIEIDYDTRKRASSVGLDVTGPRLRIPLYENPKERDFQVAGAGQYTIPHTVTSELERKLVEGNVLRNVCRVIRTTDDGPQDMHLNDDSGNAAQQLDESTPATPANSTPTKKTLLAIECQAAAKSSNKWLRSTVLNAVSFISEDLGLRIAAKQAQQGVSGNGTTGWEGVLHTADDSVTAEEGNITLANINALYRACRERNQAVFMMNSGTLGHLEDNLKDDNGNLIFALNAREGGPTTLKGRPILINEYMPDYDDAGVMPIVFFNPSKYIIRDVNSIEIETERSALGRTTTFVATLTSYGMGLWYPTQSNVAILTYS